MSGSFLDMDVPPTLVSFAIAPADAESIVSPEFKKSDDPVYLFTAPKGDYEATLALWVKFHELVKAGKVKAAWAVEAGGVAEAVMKMSFGNGVGFAYEKGVGAPWFGPAPGMIVAELTEEVSFGEKIGVTTGDDKITLCGESVAISELLALNDAVLE